MSRAPNLVIIGGAEDKTGPCTILAEVVRRAGGRSARIAVIPAASELAETGADYATVFERLGAERVDILDVSSREHAHAPEHEDVVAAATAVFLTGGDQVRLMNRIGGTPLDRALHRRVEEGMVVAGTSAGAAVMSGTMIADGDADRVQANAVRTAPGLELLPGVVIDQHFAQRGRIGRLLAVVALYPHFLGVGIDEDTALLVRGHHARVLGRGSVTILDAGSATLNDATEVPPTARISLAGVTLHSLASGREFELMERRSLAPPAG